MKVIDKAERRLTVRSESEGTPLTALLRAWLNRDLSMALESGRSLAVFVVRIDEYQELSAQCSGQTMQSAMTTLASRLEKVLRPADASIRSAEDSFTVIHSFDGDPLTLYNTGKMMLQHLQQPIRFGSDDRCIAASIGISFYPEDGNSAELLLGRAQEALNRTDRWGGNGFCLSSRTAAKNVADELSKHEDLRRALDANDLSMRFQPILDLPRNCMTAVTGEIHWQHPLHGRLEREDIASIAERADLGSRLSELMIDRVCRQLSDWRGAGFDRSISIDVSRSQIIDSRLARHLSVCLSAPGITPDMLEVRLDHQALLAETDHRIRAGLQHLAELGVGISLSKVGRGALATQSLQNFPFHSVCLAPEMIGAIGRCSATETMLQAMIGFFHSLGLCIRAVDVRFQEQVDFLKHYGCDEATGPFFAPALEGGDIDRLTSFSPCVGRQENIVLMPQHMSMH